MGSAACYGKPLFASLWVRAWGEQYPVDVQPFSSCTRELLHQLTQRIDLPPGGVFADLGCGSGGVTLWLARERSDAHGIGVDHKPAAIDIARVRTREWKLEGRAEFRCADFVATGLASRSADAVVSVDALPSGAEVDSVLRECARILKPGGHLVFTARQPAADSERWLGLGPEWRTVLQRTGFQLLECSHRPNVSSLWRQVYAEWVAHEAALRRELPDATVDALMAEAHAAGPTMDEDRPWLLITAGAVAAA